jgi:hypothetical protein
MHPDLNYYSGLILAPQHAGQTSNGRNGGKIRWQKASICLTRCQINCFSLSPTLSQNKLERLLTYSLRLSRELDGARTLSTTTFNVITLSIPALSVMGLYATPSIIVSSTVMLSVFMLNVAFLLLCWVLFCWTSLYWVSLCWMSSYWVSLCWVAWRQGDNFRC